MPSKPPPPKNSNAGYIARFGMPGPKKMQKIFRDEVVQIAGGLKKYESVWFQAKSKYGITGIVHFIARAQTSSGSAHMEVTITSAGYEQQLKDQAAEFVRRNPWLITGGM